MNKLWVLPLLFSATAIIHADGCVDELKTLKAKIISEHSNLSSEEISELRAQMKQAHKEAQEGQEQECKNIIAPIQAQFESSEEDESRD